MSQSQTQHLNIDSRNRYYNEGPNEDEDDEEEEIEMYGEKYQDEEVNNEEEENLQNQALMQSMLNQMQMRQREKNKQNNQNEEDFQGDEAEQLQYNQRVQLQHLFMHDQDHPGAIEKQWFYSFQENSEDNLDNVQQVSQIPSSQFQSQQQSMQNSQQKFPPYINHQQLQGKQVTLPNGQHFQQNYQDQNKQIYSEQDGGFVYDQIAGVAQENRDNMPNLMQQQQIDANQMRINHSLLLNLQNRSQAMQQQENTDNIIHPMNMMRQPDSQSEQLLEQEGEQQEQEEEQLEQEEQQLEQQEEQQMIICNQCKDFPLNYIELNCQHSFCLDCMAQWFMEQEYLTLEQIFEQPLSSTDDNYSELKEELTVNVDCFLCAMQTLLDYDSVEAVKEVIRQIQINLMQSENLIQSNQLPPNQQYQQQSNYTLYEQDNNQHRDQHKQIREDEDNEDRVEDNQVRVEDNQEREEDNQDYQMQNIQQSYQNEQFEQQSNNDLQGQLDENQLYQQQMNAKNTQPLVNNLNDEAETEDIKLEINNEKVIAQNKQGDKESENIQEKQKGKNNKVVNVSSYINSTNIKQSNDQLAQSFQQSNQMQYLTSNPPQITNINLSKLQPINSSQPQSTSPVLIIQNDSHLNSHQPNRQEIIYEDSSETFQTEETNRNHNSNNNVPSSLTVSKQELTPLQQQQQQQLQQNMTNESKSSSSMYNYQNQNYIREDAPKKTQGKEAKKFINITNKNYHHVNSQQSFSNNNSPQNNSTPYDTNSMHIFSKKNQDYNSFSNSQFNASSMTPQSQSDINYQAKDQQMIQKHGLPFNDLFQNNNLISPQNMQQQQQQLSIQQQQQYYAQQQQQQNQMQLGELTHSNYSGGSSSHMHEGSTMSDIQKKVIQKATNEPVKGASDKVKKIAAKMTPQQVSSEKNVDGYQLEDVQEHYGEQTDDDDEDVDEGDDAIYDLEYQKQNSKNVMMMMNKQQDDQHYNENDCNQQKELDYDDFANMSESNVQEEDSFQQNNLEFNNQNNSLRDSQKQVNQYQGKGNRIISSSQENQQRRQTNLSADRLSQQSTYNQQFQIQQQQQNKQNNSNQFAQQIQKIQQLSQPQKDQLRDEVQNQINTQNIDFYQDQKFISRDLKKSGNQYNQQQQQQWDENENYDDDIENKESDEIVQLDYDMMAIEGEENEQMDEQQVFSNQLYQQIKSEQTHNLEQKINKLSKDQTQKQYNKYQSPNAEEGCLESVPITPTAIDYSYQLPQKGAEKYDKSQSSVRPLQNVNQYEPLEDSSVKKKSNQQKFIMSNSNNTTNNNNTNNNTNNNNNSNFSTVSNFNSNAKIANQLSQNVANTLIDQNNIDNLKFRMPQYSQAHQSFNSSINEEKQLNPLSSTITGEKSIDQSQQKSDKLVKRNSQQCFDIDDNLQQQSTVQNVDKNMNQIQQVAKQNDQQQRRNTTDIRQNTTSNTNLITKSTSQQQNYEPAYEKKRHSQTNQQNSNVMNDKINESDIIEKKINTQQEKEQDNSVFQEQKAGQSISKYDLPMKQANQKQDDIDKIRYEQQQQQQLQQQKQHQIQSNVKQINQSPQISSQKQTHNTNQLANQHSHNQNSFNQGQNQAQGKNIRKQNESQEQEEEQQDGEMESMELKFQPYCDEHPYEEVNFFNFTLNKCICLKCLQKGDFIAQDVTNFEKAQDLILEKVDHCTRQIHVSIELIKLTAKRQEEKHRKRLEINTQAKIIISEQIQQIFQKLEEKQIQLLLEADEMDRQSEEILSSSVDQLQEKLKILGQLHSHFNEINEKSIQPNAKTFKEYSFCKNILDQFLYENEDILSLANHTNIQASPNSSASKNNPHYNQNQGYFLQQSQQEIINNFKSDEVTQFIDQISFLKNKITEIKGVELGTTHSSLRNSFSNIQNAKNQSLISGSNINQNNISISQKIANKSNNYVQQAQCYANEDPSNNNNNNNNNNQGQKEPKPYYKSSDKSSRRLSSSQKQGGIQGQQQYSYCQYPQEMQNVHFSPSEQQQQPQNADSYQMYAPNAFESDEQAINFQQLFQQQQNAQQNQQTFASSKAAAASSNATSNMAKKRANDQMQYVMGSNQFEKERMNKDTNSTFSSQNLNYQINNNSLNFANPNNVNQKVVAGENAPSFQSYMHSPPNQQQLAFSNNSISYQNLMKSQSQKNLYEQQQQLNLQYPNINSIQDQIPNNPLSPSFINTSNNNALINEYQERKQQKTDPGNGNKSGYLGGNNSGYINGNQNRQREYSSTNKIQQQQQQQQHLQQFNQILNNHLGNGLSSHNMSNLNSHAISLLDGGVSHHLVSASEASRNIQLIDDQFANFKSNLAEEFNNSLENHSLKRPSQPSTSASKIGQSVIDLFRKTNSVANILSVPSSATNNHHQSPGRYTLLKGSNTSKVGSTINSTLPKSNEYYNKSSFVSNYYNSKIGGTYLGGGGVGTYLGGGGGGTNSNNSSNPNINTNIGNSSHNTFSHRAKGSEDNQASLATNTAAATLPLHNYHNQILSKKRQFQIQRSHFNSAQNNSQNNINNFSSELKNSFCDQSINNSGNRYNGKKGDLTIGSSYVNNTLPFPISSATTTTAQQLYNAPQNNSFSKSKQASHGNLNSFYNNNTSMNNTNMNINNNNIMTNTSNNINNASQINHTLGNEFNHNISFQQAGKPFNIKNNSTIDSKNSGYIYKSLKKYQDLFRRQKKIMFEHENI